MAQEMFDVLDDRGNKTGEVLSNDLVHERELWHGVVHVWILNSKNEILLQLRGPKMKLFPNCWDTSVAGHISAGDTKEQAALREIEEEIGVKVDEDDLTELGAMSEQLPYKAGGKHKEHVWVFLLRKDLDIASLKLQSNELTEVKWFSAKELEDLLKDSRGRKKFSAHDDALFYFAISAAKN